MPVIKEEDLVKMHQKIEVLERENEQTNQFYTEKLKRATSTQKQQKLTITIVSCLASLAFIGMGTLWFFKVYKAQKPEKVVVEKVVEKIVEVPSKKVNTARPNFYYSAQIGAFKKLDIVNTENLMVYKENGYNEYLIGVFEKYKDTKDFISVLDKLGFTDAYVIALQNGKKIPIEQALKMSKEEGMFLKYRKIAKENN